MRALSLTENRNQKSWRRGRGEKGPIRQVPAAVVRGCEVVDWKLVVFAEQQSLDEGHAHSSAVVVES